MSTLSHVLIAEDNTLIRKLLLRFLVQLYPTAQLTTVEDGRAALDRYRTSGADLIITNTDMPRMSGMELRAAIRAEGDMVPMICIAASDAPDWKSTYDRATVFLLKPFSAPDIQRAIEILFDR